MKNKKLIQLIFAIVLLIGFVLCFFKTTKAFGFLLLCILQPTIGLYYLSIFKKEETDLKVEKLVLRYPLLLFIQGTFISLVVQRLFMSMHWPFAGPMNVIAFGLSFSTIIIGCLYVFLNRKQIQSIFVIEFVLIAMTMFIFVGIYMPKQLSSDDYAKMLHTEFNDLNKIERKLYNQINKDSSIDLFTINTLENIKNEMMSNTGGYDENMEIIGGLDKIYPEENRFLLRKLKNDSLTFILNKEPRVVLDYLNTLTKIQIDLLLKVHN